MFPDSGNPNPFGAPASFQGASTNQQTGWQSQPPQGQNNFFGSAPVDPNLQWPSSSSNIKPPGPFAQQSHQPQGDMAMDDGSLSQHSSVPNPFTAGSKFQTSLTFGQPATNGVHPPTSTPSQAPQSSHFFQSASAQPSGPNFQPSPGLYGTNSNPFAPAVPQQPQANNFLGNNQVQFSGVRGTAAFGGPATNGFPLASTQQPFSQGSLGNAVSSDVHGSTAFANPRKEPRKAIGSMSSSSVAKMLDSPLPPEALAEVKLDGEPHYNPVSSMCQAPNRPKHGSDISSKISKSNLEENYKDMLTRREAERKHLVETGVITDEDQRMTLADAIDFRGICTTLCSPDEVLIRVYQNAVDPCEKGADGQPDPDKFVKRFVRSAAGIKSQLPKDVRPPLVLVGSMKYLSELCNIIGISTTHSFIRDRTRAIRNDFTLQNYTGPEAVYCHELIARFHIVSLHLLAGKTGFDEPQEKEQLGKTLTSLDEYYGEKHKELSYYETEPEFRAYWIILNHADADMDTKVSRLPRVIRENPLVQMAMHIRHLLESNTMPGPAPARDVPSRFGAAPEMTQSNEVALFSFIQNDGVPPMIRCMVSCRFQDMRRRALTKLCHHAPNNSKTLTLSFLRELLMYPDEASLKRELDNYGFQLKEEGNTYYMVPTKQFWPEDKPETRSALFQPGLLQPLNPSMPGDLWFTSCSAPSFNDLDADSTEDAPKQPYVPRLLQGQGGGHGKQDSMAQLLPPHLKQQLQQQLAVKVSDNRRMITQSRRSVPNHRSAAPNKPSTTFSSAASPTAAPEFNPFAQVKPSTIKSNIPNPFASVPKPSPSATPNNPFAPSPQQKQFQRSSTPDGFPPSSTTPASFNGFPNSPGFQTSVPTPFQPRPPGQTFSPNHIPSGLSSQPNQKVPKPLSPSSKSMLFNPPGSASLKPPSVDQKDEKAPSPGGLFHPPGYWKSDQPTSTESANDFFSKAREQEAREKAKASINNLKSKTPPLVEKPAPTNNTATHGGIFSSIPSQGAPQAPGVLASIPSATVPQAPPSAPFPFNTQSSTSATGLFFTPSSAATPLAVTGLFQPTAPSTSSLFAPLSADKLPSQQPVATFNFQLDGKKADAPIATVPLSEPIPDPDAVGEHPNQAILDERARMRYLNNVCYRRLVSWREAAMEKHRIRQRKLRQQQKEAKAKARRRQWLPFNVDPEVSDEHFADIQAQVFQSVNTPYLFYKSLETIFDAAGVHNQTYQLWTRSDCPVTSYWWREKFVKGKDILTRSLKNDNIFEARFCEENTDISHVGALIYGCSADYNIPLEQRWLVDRKKIGEAVRRMVHESEYQAFSVMVVAYRAPLEHEDEDYRRPLDESSEERAERIKLIEKALGLDELDHRVIYASVSLVDDDQYSSLGQAVENLANSIRLKPDTITRQNGQILTPETANGSPAPVSPPDNSKRGRGLQPPDGSSTSKRQCTPEKWSLSPEPRLRHQGSKGSLKPVRGGVGFLQKIKGGFSRKKKDFVKPVTPQRMSPDLTMVRTVSASSTDSITRKRRNIDTAEEGHHRRVGGILKKARLGAGNTGVRDTPEKRAEDKAQLLGLKPLSFRSGPRMMLSEQEKVEEVKKRKRKQHEEELERSLMELEEIEAMGRSVSSFLGKGSV